MSKLDDDFAEFFAGQNFEHFQREEFLFFYKEFHRFRIAKAARPGIDRALAEGRWAAGRKPKLQPEDQQRVVSMFRKGLDKQAIANKMGVDRGVVRRILIKNGSI